MKKGLLSILAVLACGAALALAVSAGQLGQQDEIQSEKIRSSTVEDCQFTYTLAAGQETGQLKLVVIDKEGNMVKDADVVFTVLDPAQQNEQVKAEELVGGFGANIAMQTPGTYRIKTDVRADDRLLTDEFEYQVEVKGN